MLTRRPSRRLAWAAVVAASCSLLPSSGSAAPADDAPEPATLVRPADGAAMPGGRAGGDVVLAWQSPSPQEVLYFVEVIASGPDEPREVFAGYTRQTELRVRLDEAGRYRWRVLSVSRVTAHYSVSPWSSFTVGSASR